jgi:hypothetical protein
MENIEQTTRTIKALIEKGDKAKEKSRQFYVAAGLHLKTLRDAAPSKKAWAQLIDEKCNLHTTRAYELIQMADGRTTVEKVRADTNKRKVKHRARPFRNGQPESYAPLDSSDITAAISRLAHQLVQLDIELARELRRALQLGGAGLLVITLNTEIEIAAPITEAMRAA